MHNDISTKLLTMIPTLQGSPFSSDLRQEVAESFWKHNKDMPTNLMDKLENTELLLRYIKMNGPHLFK